MPSTAISNAITTPEDEGTGVPTDTADWTSAGHVAAMAAAQATTAHVHAGLGLTPDWGAETVDVGGGLAFVRHSGGATVQDGDGNYNTSWDEDLTFASALPPVADVALDTSVDVNHLWLSLVSTANNSANYVTRAEGNPPSEPRLKIGTLDRTAQEAAEANRGPQVDHLASTLARALETGESTVVPEGQGMVVSGPYDVEGEVDVRGQLDVASPRPTPKRHDHRGDVLRPGGVAPKQRVEHWETLEVPEGHGAVVADELVVEGETEVEGALKVI